MDKDILEFLYQSGKMPFKYYAQQNGKSPQENYRLQKDLIHDKLKKQEAEKEVKEYIKDQLENIFLSLLK